VAEHRPGATERLISFFVDSGFVVAVLVAMLVVGGIITSPFRWSIWDLPQSPVPVDAIPDTGENQQIVFTEWPGRSPKDIEDQVTYPLTSALLGIGGVKTIRSTSMFGVSSIYVIFDETEDYYGSRTRVLEKLASLPADTLPDGVAPALGPDATALGQVFWYTLEGRDEAGRPVGGWDEHELRSIQDWTVRYALQSVPGVSEVASVGGYVKEYQVDIDPEALLAFDVGVDDVAMAVSQANLDVGARTIEINRAEYVVRGLGFIKQREDLEEVVVESRTHTPVRIRDVARVVLGPAERRGTLDINGASAVGGVVVIRFGANPLEVIEAVKAKMEEIAPGLPKRRLDDGRVSVVQIVPFYDRTELIEETLGTLSTALRQQVLVTLIVVLVLLRRVRSALLICIVVPFGILGAFIAMRWLGVDANIMALSGIAIAIGTMVDMGIVLTEAMTTRLELHPEEPIAAAVKRAAGEVAPAVLTSTATTVVSFLPVFGLTAAEGKLFRPLAFTKTFAMLAALLIAVIVLPAAAALVLRRSEGLSRRFARLRERMPSALGRGERLKNLLLFVVVAAISIGLADDWLPLGVESGYLKNRIFVLVVVALVLILMSLFVWIYPRAITISLARKGWLVAGAGIVVLSGLLAWRGFDSVFAWLPESVAGSPPARALSRTMPGLGREYMPPLDEGAFLYMPATMPHASIGQAQEQLATMDAAIASVPEVRVAAGKLGRAESALDPAPITMFETVVTYLPEYKTDRAGRRMTFAYDEEAETFLRDDRGELIPDDDGRAFRQWRDHIRTPDDIWEEVRSAAKLPGVTDAPHLQPIAARLVMLQSGMRAPMGLKIRGPDLATIESTGLEMERILKEVSAIRPETVIADRIVGAPYLEIDIDRAAIARHGISVVDLQEVVQTAIGGQVLTRTVEGRERYPVRVRYMRERRDSPDAFGRVLVPSPLGHQIPLDQLASIRYARGPQMIKSEDTFLTGYVLFDKHPGHAEVDAVEAAQARLKERIQSGDLVLPEGVSYAFAGTYENQLRSEARLKVLVPTALAIVMLLIYMQFRRATTALIIGSAVLVSISGGFILLWLYGKAWFLDASPFGVDLRALFQVDVQNVSVAVWVGFIALLGIATDDGVVMSTYLHQRFADAKPTSIEEIREWVAEGANRRLRACVMTTATTMLALLPVMTSMGRGADVMLPMALPVFGGMLIELTSLFLVPALFAWREEITFRRRAAHASYTELRPM
jgi:copper/silver efflux system protein